jgi:hypothetical protein
MSSIIALQHIYGNVEKADSPSNTGGFQTLFYSKEHLSLSEADEIERRLGYYPSEDNPEKLIFFRMGEKFVTTRIIPLEDIDKFGRKGAYIAHSFVFSASDFSKINNNPFIIFELFENQFVKTLPEALSRGKKGDTNIPPLELPINPDQISIIESEMIDLIKPWKTDEIRKLVSVAMNETKLKNESKSFIISGPQRGIRNTIKAIFSLIPDKIRSSCSFDTYFSGCNPVATRYWVYGYPKTPNVSPQIISANAETATVSNFTPESGSPYENWIFGSNYPDDIGEKIVFRNAARELDRFLTGRESDKEQFLAFIGSPNLETFLNINHQQFQTKLHSCFREILSEHLGTYAERAVLTEYHAKPDADLLQKMISGFTADELAPYLFHELKGITSPKKQEITELQAFLARKEHTLLRILYLKWTESFDTLPRYLAALPENEYITAVDLLIDKAELKPLIIDARISLFTEIFVTVATEKENVREKILDLINVCFTLNQEPLLLKLVPLVPGLRTRQLKLIQDFIDEQKEEKKKKIPPEFTKTLSESLKNAQSKSSFFDKMKEKIFD